ncbi:MAG: bifunctional hydroxymethylpyrimidine kinase/phosphomethylpyrimidine kinase [Nitrososphaerales archaeon]
MAKALTIGGSDTSSGAGIQADLRIFSTLKVYGMSVITALTAQNTRSVSRIAAIGSGMVRAQIHAVLDDISIDAIKIGMVYSKEIINSVASVLRDVNVPMILDPIFKAGTGKPLLRNDAYTSFVKRLVPIVDVITPNLMEAEKLANMEIHTVDDSKDAVEKIAALGVKNVIIKGGHLQGKHSTDILYHRKHYFEFTNERIRNEGLHGSGCTFSAALTAEIAKGKNIVDATKRANEFVRTAILNASKIGKGIGIPSFEVIIPTNNLLAALHKAVCMLEDTESFGTLIPESQSNIVYAKANAKSLDDIAAVRGRIVKIGKKAKSVSNVGFGASKHVASAVIAIMYHDKSVRSAINIKYDEKIIDICKDLGLKISSYDRQDEPAEVKSAEGRSVKWGIEEAVSKIKTVPDVIYHLGDWGKEPMILVFGKNPSNVSNRIISILQKYKI